MVISAVKSSVMPAGTPLPLIQLPLTLRGADDRDRLLIGVECSACCCFAGVFSGTKIRPSEAKVHHAVDAFGKERRTSYMLWSSMSVLVRDNDGRRIGTRSDS